MDVPVRGAVSHLARAHNLSIEKYTKGNWQDTLNGLVGNNNAASTTWSAAICYRGELFEDMVGLFQLDPNRFKKGKDREVLYEFILKISLGDNGKVTSALPIRTGFASEL